MACELLDRRDYGIAVCPGYCDVIVARWEELTGAKAELESTKVIESAGATHLRVRTMK